MAKLPLARPSKGLRLPSDRRSLPPVVQAIVFLLVFKTAISLVSVVWNWWASPGWDPGARIGTTVVLIVMGIAFTAILTAIVTRGSILAPYVLTVVGVIGAANVIHLTMIDVVFAAASVLLVILAWSPAAREHGRRMRAARRGGPRLPYRYEGPAPKREDFSAGP